MEKNIEEAKKCLTALGSAWRGSWSDFDGRTLRSQLNEIINVLDGEETYLKFCEINDIHPTQKCWNEYAND